MSGVGRWDTICTHNHTETHAHSCPSANHCFKHLDQASCEKHREETVSIVESTASFRLCQTTLTGFCFLAWTSCPARSASNTGGWFVTAASRPRSRSSLVIYSRASASSFLAVILHLHPLTVPPRHQRSQHQATPRRHTMHPRPLPKNPTVPGAAGFPARRRILSAAHRAHPMSPLHRKSSPRDLPVATGAPFSSGRQLRQLRLPSRAS